MRSRIMLLGGLAILAVAAIFWLLSQQIKFDIALPPSISLPRNSVTEQLGVISRITSKGEFVAPKGEIRLRVEDDGPFVLTFDEKTTIRHEVKCNLSKVDVREADVLVYPDLTEFSFKFSSPVKVAFFEKAIIELSDISLTSEELQDDARKDSSGKDQPLVSDGRLRLDLRLMIADSLTLMMFGSPKSATTTQYSLGKSHTVHVAKLPEVHIEEFVLDLSNGSPISFLGCQLKLGPSSQIVASDFKFKAADEISGAIEVAISASALSADVAKHYKISNALGSNVKYSGTFSVGDDGLLIECKDKQGKIAIDSCDIAFANGESTVTFGGRTLSLSVDHSLRFRDYRAKTPEESKFEAIAGGVFANGEIKTPYVKSTGINFKAESLRVFSDTAADKAGVEIDKQLRLDAQFAAIKSRGESVVSIEDATFVAEAGVVEHPKDIDFSLHELFVKAKSVTGTLGEKGLVRIEGAKISSKGAATGKRESLLGTKFPLTGAFEVDGKIKNLIIYQSDVPLFVMQDVNADLSLVAETDALVLRGSLDSKFKGTISGFGFQSKKGDIKCSLGEISLSEDQKQLHIKKLEVSVARRFINDVIGDATKKFDIKDETEHKFIKGLADRRRDEMRAHSISLSVERVRGNKLSVDGNVHVSLSEDLHILTTRWEMRRVKTGPITWGKTKVPVEARVWKEVASVSGRVAASGTLAIEFNENVPLSKLSVKGELSLEDVDINFKNVSGEAEKWAAKVVLKEFGTVKIGATNLCDGVQGEGRKLADRIVVEKLEVDGSGDDLVIRCSGKIAL